MRRRSTAAVFMAVLLAAAFPGATARADEKARLQGEVAQVPKDVFWRLGILKVCVLGSGHTDCYWPTEHQGPTYVAVPINTHVYIECTSQWQPPPASQITNADIAYWGSGKFSYRVDLDSNAQPYWPQQGVLGCTTCRQEDMITLTLPPFTLADVQRWAQEGMTGGNDPHFASTETIFKKEDVGKTFTPLCLVHPIGFWHTEWINGLGSVQQPTIRVGELAVGAQLPGATASTQKPVTDLPAGAAVATGKADVIVKSFTLSPQKPVGGMPFDLTVDVWNKGAITSEPQQFSLSWKVVSGGPSSPTSATNPGSSTQPIAPGGTQSIWLKGLKGNQGSYELTVTLLPQNVATSYQFSIGPGLPAMAPAVQQQPGQRLQPRTGATPKK